MAYTLQYFDEVETDVQQAKTWLKEQKEGLEIDFAAAIEKAIEYILEAPKTYAVRYNKIRMAHPKRFPYNIHFYIDEPNTTVVITAIVHSKRHPKVAKKRL
jgi:plasmid stabilization system protein ParE